ncbi:Histone-lysine N-methyltransferase 1 [Chlorella vulgaris]
MQAGFDGSPPQVSACMAGTADAAAKAGEPAISLSDGEVRRGVKELFLALRKSYAARQRRQAAEIAASNAAKMRGALQQQERERQQLTASAQAGLPATAARGTGAAAWCKPRAIAAEQQRRRQQPQDGQTLDSQGGSEGGVRGVRPVPSQQLQAVKSLVNYVGGKAVHLQAFVLPTAEAVPPYKSWVHVPRNCVSQETGKRMFYTDEKGETVPVSDDEADVEHQLDHQRLHGIHRLWLDHVISQVTAQFGTGSAVFAALYACLIADRACVSAAALESRAAELAAQTANEALLRQQQPLWEDKSERLSELELSMHSSWCRRCRTFACSLHKGLHDRPVVGPIRGAEQQRAVPRAAAGQLPSCGPSCYLMSQQEGVEEAPRQASAASCPAPGSSNHTVPQQQEQKQQQQQQEQQQEEEGGERGEGPGPLLQSGERVPGLPPTDGPAPAATTDQEAMSQPAKQLRMFTSAAPSQQQAAHGGSLAAAAAGINTATGSSAVIPAARPAGSGAAAAAAAAAAHVPLRRRRDSGSAGGSGDAASEPGGGGASAAEGDAPWTQWEVSLLEQGIEVHCRMQRLAEDKAGGCGTAEDLEQQQQQQRRGRGGRKAAKASVKLKFTPAATYERSRRPTNEMWPQFQPCTCVGECRVDCPCSGNANFCEKFCACDATKCRNRFQGCACKCGNTASGKRCTNKHCPCLAAGRECDPDLCGDCKDTLTGEHREGWQCNNFRIRLGQGKRVLMGLSDVQGWGAFLQQRAQKDEFVGEYCGELIGHEEADRRGTVYDRDDNSYLFNLNEEWVIDARRKGNTLRFANHSTNANCRAEILMVDGDHRVAIMTNRELREGEEIFYNYNYDKRVAPDWAVGMQQGQGAGKGAAKKSAALRRHGSRLAAASDCESDSESMDRGTVQTGSVTAAGGGVLPTTPASPVASETHSGLIRYPSTLTVGGRDYGTNSNREYKVVQREQVANPAPLGLFAFGYTTALLQGGNTAITDPSSGQLAAAFGMFYGGLAQLLAGMWEFKRQNTFGAVAFSSYGAFWMGFAILQILVAADLFTVGHNADQMMLSLWGILTFIFMIATLELNFCLTLLFFLLAVLFWMLAAGVEALFWTRLGGWWGLVVAGVAWYIAAADVLNEQFKRTVLPIGKWNVPVIGWGEYKAKDEEEAGYPAGAEPFRPYVLHTYSAPQGASFEARSSELAAAVDRSGGTGPMDVVDASWLLHLLLRRHQPAVALIGAVVTGVLARRRRVEMQGLNTKLRQINSELRRQREAQDAILAAISLAATPQAGAESDAGSSSSEGPEVAAALEALRLQREALQQERSVLEQALASPSAAHPTEGFGDQRLSLAHARRRIAKCIRGGKELVRDGRPSEAYPIIEQGLQLALETADLRAERALMRVRARALRDAGDPASSLRDLQRSIALSEQLGEGRNTIRMVDARKPLSSVTANRFFGVALLCVAVGTFLALGGIATAQSLCHDDSMLEYWTPGYAVFVVQFAPVNRWTCMWFQYSEWWALGAQLSFWAFISIAWCTGFLERHAMPMFANGAFASALCVNACWSLMEKGNYYTGHAYTLGAIAFAGFVIVMVFNGILGVALAEIVFAKKVAAERLTGLSRDAGSSDGLKDKRDSPASSLAPKVQARTALRCCQHCGFQIVNVQPKQRVVLEILGLRMDGASRVPLPDSDERRLALRPDEERERLPLAAACTALLLLLLGLSATATAKTLAREKARRYLSMARFFLVTLHRRPVTLHNFQAGVAAEYASHHFERPLQALEMLQLALRAGFSLAAAASLNSVHSAHFTPGTGSRGLGPVLPPYPHGGTASSYGGYGDEQPHVTDAQYIQLATLELVRLEWEQPVPLLICGFDGTCLTRLGSEVGGIIVSLRPDGPPQPAEPRKLESYFNSITCAELSGRAYEAEQMWVPDRRLRTQDGSITHVFVPDASLLMHGSLWACLRRMRHTQLLLYASDGHLLPSANAFNQRDPRPTRSQLDAWRRKALQQHVESLQAKELAAAACSAGRAETEQAAATMATAREQHSEVDTG